MFWEDYAPFVIGSVVVVLMFGCIFGAIFLTTRQGCIETGEVTGLTVEWRLFGGCFVELDGRMIPYDTWQLIQIQQVDK